MKLKIMQLLLLFLATGLLVSSKEKAIKTKKACTAKCVLPNKSTVKKEVKKKKTAANPFALTPGSYIFYY